MNKNPTDNRNQTNAGMSKEKTSQENEKQKSFPNDEQPEKNHQEIESDNVKNDDATQNSSKLNNQSNKENEPKSENKTETQDSDKGKL